MEVVANVRHDLAIGGMVSGLDTHDVRGEAWRMLLRVSQEAQLGHRRPHDQNLVGVRQRDRDGVEEVSFVVGMIASLRLLALRVPMDVMSGRMNRRFIEGLRGHVEHACFVVIDPYRHSSHLGFLLGLGKHQASRTAVRSADRAA